MQHGDKEVLELWSLLQRKLPDLFKGIKVEPALIHGDLLSGNVAETLDGPGNEWNRSTPCICDSLSWLNLYNQLVATKITD